MVGVLFFLMYVWVKGHGVGRLDGLEKIVSFQLNCISDLCSICLPSAHPFYIIVLYINIRIQRKMLLFFSSYIFSGKSTRSSSK